MVRALLLFLAVTACKGDRDDCALAVERLWQRNATAPSTRAVVAAVEASCRDARWSADTLDCMKSAVTTEDRRTCVASLTREQRTAMDGAVARTGLAGLAELRDRICACRGSAACTFPLEREKTSLDVTMQGVRRGDPAVQEAWLKLAAEVTRCLESRR